MWPFRRRQLRPSFGGQPPSTIPATVLEAMSAWNLGAPNRLQLAAALTYTEIAGTPPWLLPGLRCMKVQAEALLEAQRSRTYDWIDPWEGRR